MLMNMLWRPLLKVTSAVGSLLLCSSMLMGQVFSSKVAVLTVYSQNNQFYLKSVPYDDEEPSLSGKTSVFSKDSPKPVYVFERGFDSTDYYNNLILSNDGEVIFFAIPEYADEKRDGLKSVTIYKHGKIVK